MNFWTLLVGWPVLLALAPAAGAADREPMRPNFLWLIAEDLGPHLGCCGTREGWTPNLDRLAAEGVRYPHGFLRGGSPSGPSSATLVFASITPTPGPPAIRDPAGTGS